MSKLHLMSSEIQPTCPKYSQFNLKYSQRGPKYSKFVQITVHLLQKIVTLIKNTSSLSQIIFHLEMTVYSVAFSNNLLNNLAKKLLLLSLHTLVITCPFSSSTFHIWSYFQFLLTIAFSVTQGFFF